MKTSTLLLGTLVIVTNGWWIFRNIDQGVTNTYQEQERYESANRVVALSALAAEAVKGRSKADTETLLKRLFPDQEPFEKDGALHTPWITFPISADDRIIGVELDKGTRELAKPFDRRVQ